MVSRVRLKRITLAALCILSLSRWSVAGASDDFARLQLGDYELRIPTQNAVSEPVPSWLRWLPGLDDGVESLLFILYADDIKEEIDDFQISDGEYIDNIRGIITILTPSEVARYRDPRQFAELSDLWFATGPYRNRRVEEADISGLYKVFYDDQYKSGWALLNRYPDPGKPLPKETLEFWVANCIAGGRPIGATGKGITCRSHVLLDDILIEFRVSHYNIKIIDNIRAFIKRTVSNWVHDST